MGWSFGRKKVEGNDIATFHVLTGPDPYLGYIPCVHDSGYAVDRFHAYWRGNPIPGADPRTFTYLQWDYSRDRSHVYYQTSALIGADVRTFRYIGQQYFQDGVHVYLRGAVVNGADPKTFVLLNKPVFPGWTLARDTSHVFFGATAIAGASPKDARYLGGPYWTSNHMIFWKDEPLRQADSASFRLASKGERAFWAEDKGYYYWDGKAFDKKECRTIGPEILPCRNGVWFQGWKYSRLDSTSMRYLGGFPPKLCAYKGTPTYQDRHGVYLIYGDQSVERFLRTHHYPRIEHLDTANASRLCHLGGTADVWPDGWFDKLAHGR